MRSLLPFLLAFPLVAAPPNPRKNLLRVPVWADAKDANASAPLDAKGFSVKLDGEPARVVSAQGPGDDLLVLLALDWSEDMDLVNVAKEALATAVQSLPPKVQIGLLRAQDGLHVLTDPTPNRTALIDTIRALPVSGKAGLLDTVELAARIADSILAKAAVRVAVVYISDSNIYNYREDFINPVINSSDQHDMSRRFPEGLVRERISKLEGKLAAGEAPLFIVHLAYRSDRLNEAYQNGLMQLAATAGGASAFCRSRAEIPDAIEGTFRTAASHYSLVLRMPDRPSKVVQVQIENEGHTLTYRNRFVFQER